MPNLTLPRLLYERYPEIYKELRLELMERKREVARKRMKDIYTRARNSRLEAQEGASQSQ
jgi:hypothetical protein